MPYNKFICHSIKQILTFLNQFFSHLFYKALLLLLYNCNIIRIVFSFQVICSFCVGDNLSGLERISPLVTRVGSLGYANLSRVLNKSDSSHFRKK